MKKNCQNNGPKKRKIKNQVNFRDNTGKENGGNFFSKFWEF